tara:strand:- start:14000 stop:14359 length:360 start_codon:yes stop_codon:yes gene_type:complete
MFSMAAFMLAGRTRIKKMSSNQAVRTLSFGISNPIANRISMTPVIYTISFFMGINSGIMAPIPWGNIKCPKEVNNNIMAMAICPANGHCIFFDLRYRIDRVATNETRSTNKGFMVGEYN